MVGQLNGKMSLSSLFLWNVVVTGVSFGDINIKEVVLTITKSGVVYQRTTTSTVLLVDLAVGKPHPHGIHDCRGN